MVLVTGLSGAGKASILRVLEDLGFETVDNPPLKVLEELVEDGEEPIAAGIDTRTRGFVPTQALVTLARLRRNPAIAVTPGLCDRRGWRCCCAATPRRGGATRWRRAARSATG